MDYTGKNELKESELGLIKYNNFIVKKILKSFSQNSSSGNVVLDFGSGSGTLSCIAREINNSYDYICFEPDDELQKICTEKGFSTYKSLLDIDKEINRIFSSNVLEHIEDDVAALTDLFKKLHNNSVLVLYVPAFQILYGEMDRKVEHFRRYGKKELIAKTSKVGFKIESVEYVDSVGFLVSILLKIVKYDKFYNFGDFKYLKMYDRLIFPISRALDVMLFNKLIGKNLLLVATKK